MVWIKCFEFFSASRLSLKMVIALFLLTLDKVVPWGNWWNSPSPSDVYSLQLFPRILHNIFYSQMCYVIIICKSCQRSTIHSEVSQLNTNNVLFSYCLLNICTYISTRKKMYSFLSEALKVKFTIDTHTKEFTYKFVFKPFLLNNSKLGNEDNLSKTAPILVLWALVKWSYLRYTCIITFTRLRYNPAMIQNIIFTLSYYHVGIPR